MAAMFRLVYNKVFPPPLPPPSTFEGCTVLITGATGGLGLETAVHYVSLGASTVIITARTLSRGAAAKATIETRTGRKDIVQVRELNMDTFASVKKFADSLVADVKFIDVVLLSAGVHKITYERSPDGWEETLQVNVLSTLLLGLLLLPWMKESHPVGRRPQHLGVVGSGVHTDVDIEAIDFPKHDVLRYFNEEKHFKPGGGSYSYSKLFVEYGVKEMVKLAKTSDGSPSPIVNTMCPGMCKTDLARQYATKGALMRVAIVLFYGMVGKTAEAGARTMILAAMTEPEEHGKFVKHYGTDKEYAQKAGRNITSEAGRKMQEEVWKEMLQIFEKTVPEVLAIVRPRA